MGRKEGLCEHLMKVDSILAVDRDAAFDRQAYVNARIAGPQEKKARAGRLLDPLVWGATDGPLPEATRLLGGSQKDPATDAADGPVGHLPKAEHVAAASGASDLSVFAPGCAGRSAEPGVERWDWA